MDLKEERGEMVEGKRKTEGGMEGMSGKHQSGLLKDSSAVVETGTGEDRRSDERGRVRVRMREGGSAPGPL